MLSVKQLNENVVYHFLTQLYQNVMEAYDLEILQDRQSAPRPTDASGYLRTYVYFRVESPRGLQWQTKDIVEDSGGNVAERTITQRQVKIKLNFLGAHAVDAATYFDHAINSELAYAALRPTIDGRVVEFQYNGHTDPVDLTEVEQTKWVARVEYDVLLGYVDNEDFKIDVFQNVEAELKVSDGETVVPVTVKTIIGE